jgi:hypothetical protein
VTGCCVRGGGGVWGEGHAGHVDAPDEAVSAFSFSLLGVYFRVGEQEWGRVGCVSVCLRERGREQGGSALVFDCCSWVDTTMVARTVGLQGCVLACFARPHECRL